MGPPVVLARDPWLITRDAGITLADSQRPRLESVLALQPIVARLQQEWLGRAEELITIGVPNNMTATLPARFDELIEQCIARFGHLPDALTDAEVERLRATRARVEDAVARLDALGIGATIQHDDLHAGNVLVADGEAAAGDDALAIIDWGDASVAHPFTHLTVAASALAYSLDVAIDAPAVERMRSSYLEQWTAYAPIEELRAGAHAAEWLGSILRGACWVRALEFADEDAIREFGPAVAGWLRKLLG